MSATLRRRLALLWILTVLVGGLDASSACAQEPGLTPMDVMRLESVVSVHPSPDGRQVAFVRRVNRVGKDEPGPANDHLWIVPAAGGPERRLVGGTKRVGGVSWSPDGRHVCFLDKRDGDKENQVYALPMDGGEPVRLTTVAEGVRSYAWRPDGEALAYVSPDPLPEAVESAEKLGFKPIVVDESPRNSSLSLWDVAAKTSKRLTDTGHVNAFVWSPDGRRLAAAISPTGAVDDTYMFQRLHVVDPAEPRVERLVDNPGKLGEFVFSPDGRQLAYISAADRNDPHAGMLYTVELAGGRVTPRTDGFEGMVHGLKWSEPGTIRASISRGVYDFLATMDLTTSQWTNHSERGPSFTAFETCDVGDSSGNAFLAGSTAAHPPEVYRYDGGWHRLTNSNPWLSDVGLGKQTVETITARDGLEIEGLLLYPLDYEPGRRYPLVVVAHGGPESHFSHGWNTSYGRWGQLLCARGYFAWYPNYRASTGRGVAFAKADHGDVMGAEFEDHLDAIAEFDRRGLIDKARVGIGGGSYGGYTAAWAATRHTDHFAAAVSFVPFVDIRSKWFTSDIPWEFYYVHYQEKWPHQQMDYMVERSPLSHASQCRTPLLLLGGTSDTRVHPSQPMMLYRAVKLTTTAPCRYIQYSGEGHGNAVNVNQYDFCLRTLQWFDHYLQPGDHRRDPPPPKDLDYGGWADER